MAVLERLQALAESYYREFREALRDYRMGRERVYAVERLAQLLAQTILDYAAAMAAREGEKPATYKGLAEWLSQKLGLPRELREFLVGLAGFRNILVHMYAEVDRGLEEEAFNEIEEKTPRLLEALKNAAQGDPCLGEVRERLKHIAPRLGVRVAIAFGSLARRGCGRDVDLAVRLSRRPRSLLEVGRIQAELEDALGARVDLVVLNIPVDPGLAKAIVDHWAPVYGSEEEALREVLRLYKLYLDYAETRGRS
ncbi:MAG: DUF86 domain-containing protein [Desulfurococcales archaeon]|nr:DUF86 domain-containing protein [Desulfurococcales archaeon]